METLEKLLEKVAPFTDSVEGDRVHFIAGNSPVISFQIVETENTWKLLPDMHGRPASSEGEGRDAWLRAKAFVKAFTAFATAQCCLG